ncbi:MAG: hypothetical protein ABI771_16925 [Betaproteobacteria bacterium]
MSSSTRDRPTVVCLWGGHRPAPDLDCHQTPSNADKGVRELKERGYDIKSISPWSPRRRRPQGWDRKLQYVLRIGHLLRAARQPGTVIYTTDLSWIRVLAQLRRFGFLREQRIVVHWGGIDFDPQSNEGEPYRRHFDQLFGAADAIWVASENERRIWTETLPAHAARMAFHPMFIDLAYYRQIVPATITHDVVALGSDSRRDWETPIQLAARGLQVALVTEDMDVRRRVLALPTSISRNITLAFRAGFQQSARIAASARCLLVATTPNFRFSGSNTLGVAIALRRPLVIDDPFDMPAYGLQAGVHHEAFDRGDPRSAYDAVQRVLSNADHAASLGEALATRAPSVDIDAFVDQLEASFLPGWTAAGVHNLSSLPASPKQMTPAWL